MARILVVDDERSIRRTLGEFLRDAGYDVREAEDVENAMAQLQTGPFDVVVTDIILPRVNGVELLRRIQGAAPEVRVVMMTGEPTAETAAEALRLGAVDYLFKPINKTDILRTVGNAAHIKHLEDIRRHLEAENQAHRDHLEQLVAERTGQLQTSEDRYRTLVETAFDWVWETDARGHFSFSNPRVLDLLGYHPEELVGHSPFGFLPEEEAQRVQRTFEHAIASRAPVVMLEHVMLHRDGHPVTLEVNGNPRVSSTGDFLGFRGMARDITRRKRAEDELAKLARVVEQSPACILITDRQGHIEFVNPKFSQLTGYTTAEVLGRNPRFLKSGDTSTEAYRTLWNTILAGKEWRGEFRNIRKDGSHFLEAVSISPLRDPSGRISHFISVGEDVTEKRELEARFLRAQRVESIGSLAGGIAHDLNNIIAPILLSAPLLEIEDSAAERQKLIQTIESSARRAKGIVNQLLSFARGRETLRQPVQVRHILKEILLLSRETFPRNIRIEEACIGTDLWPVLGNVTQLHQVLLNLLVNARDAMPNGGRLTLRAENVVLDEHFASVRPEVSPGPYVRLQVHDTGTGIPDSIRHRIFESFFTTKGEDQGTGLGLTTVLGIVKNHGGIIAFASEPAKGTTFEIHLPAAPAAEVVDGEQSRTPVGPQGRGELILVVDDEQAIREVTLRGLQRVGYRVIQAKDGVEALAEWSRHPGQVKAVVTDFMMPRMDGVTLCRNLRALSPSIPILVSSGGLFGPNGQQAVHAFQEMKVHQILHKPHTSEALLAALASALQPTSKHATPNPPSSM